MFYPIFVKRLRQIYWNVVCMLNHVLRALKIWNPMTFLEKSSVRQKLNVQAIFQLICASLEVRLNVTYTNFLTIRLIRRAHLCKRDFKTLNIWNCFHYSMSTSFQHTLKNFLLNCFLPRLKSCWVFLSLLASPVAAARGHFLRLRG